MFNHENYAHRLDRENIAERVPVKRVQKKNKKQNNTKRKDENHWVRFGNLSPGTNWIYVNPTKNSWRVFVRLNTKIKTIKSTKMPPRKDWIYNEMDKPTLTSVASPHFTDLESPFERTTFSVERAVSDPVDPRLELFLLLEFRDILCRCHSPRFPLILTITTVYQQPV